MQRALQIDQQTALLACAPGLLTQMGIVAHELEAQVFAVTIFQLTRLISAIVILPLVFRMLL